MYGGYIPPACYGAEHTLGISDLSMLKTKETAEKRCRILPARSLGVSPSFKKSPEIRGYRGLIKTMFGIFTKT